MRADTTQRHNQNGAARRRSGRHPNTGSGGAPPASRIQPIHWITFTAIGLISLALITLIWTLTARAVEDEETELRTRTDQQLRSVAFSLAIAVQSELRLVAQSLAIIQDEWKKGSESVDLAAWRKQLLSLTEVADDIFIANDQRIIVQGTLPRSVGQGFGSAYVMYPNGSLETFEADGTNNPDGRTPGADKIQARQFLMYVLRPLADPKGWLVGASYRSEEITKLFAGAKLGENGVVGLADTKRGALQAIVGPLAQSAEMDISSSELVGQMRKHEAGVWAGTSPMDNVGRIIAFQRLPDRDMSVIVGIATDTAMQPLSGLSLLARELAILGSLIVVILAGIVVWTIVTVQGATVRRRIRERTERDLINARHELELARSSILPPEPAAEATEQ
jgi:hypothetical protein